MQESPDTVSLVKDEAEGLFSKGRYEEALSAFARIEAHGEKDPRIYLRLGDTSRKLGDDGKAVSYYRKAVESFVRQGFVIKAIAVCKMILHIDPSEEEVNKRLAELNAGEPGTVKYVPGRAVKAGPQAGSETQRLPKTPLFSDLAEAEFLEVLKKVRSRGLKAGEFLFREGDPGDSIFFVAEGEVEVVGRTREGRETAIAALGEGEVFGEFGFFLNSRRTAGVRAGKETVVLELTKKDLGEVISRHGRIAEALFDFYKERVADRLMALSAVFGPMSQEDRKEVLKRTSVVRFAGGATVLTEGAPGETMYLIKSGKASVTVKGPGSAATITGLEEGDFFGEIALATDSPRVAGVRAETDLELLEFSRPMIKDVLAKYPGIKEILKKVIRERVVDCVRARSAKPEGLV